jgi:hypothetical protein
MSKLEKKIIKYLIKNISNEVFQRRIGFYLSNEYVCEANVIYDNKEYDLLISASNITLTNGHKLKENIKVNFEIETAKCNNNVLNTKYEDDKLLCSVLTEGTSVNSFDSDKVYSFLSFKKKKIERLNINYFAKNVKFTSEHNISVLQNIYDSKYINKRLKKPLLFFIDKMSPKRVFYESPIDMLTLTYNNKDAENIYLDIPGLRRINMSIGDS